MIHLEGDIGFEITLASTIKALEAGDRDVTLMSYGGSLIEGWGIYDYLKFNNSVDSITAFGMVASSATIIMLAAPNRKASPNSQFVIHNPWTISIGDAARFEKVANELRNEEQRLIQFYSDVTGKDYDTIKNIMDQDRSLTASEALELGLITEILNFEPMAENVTKKDLETFEDSFFQKIKNFFNPKNMVVQSTDGTELEFDSNVETTAQIEVGQGLKAGGQPATGTYVLVDGTTVTADNGVITEVMPAASPDSEEMEAVKKENEDLKAQISEMQNKINDLETVKADSKKLFDSLQEDFTAFKNKFSTDNPPAANPPAPVVPGEKKSFSYNRKS